jgi:adenine-specific DNA-methyltransferase
MFVTAKHRSRPIEALVERTEARRRRLASDLDAKEDRSERGQFFTPAPVAEFLASLLELPTNGTFRLLDPGAGIGSLTAAVVARVLREQPRLALEVVAFEVDPKLEPHLRQTLADCERVAGELGSRVQTQLRLADFVEWASTAISGSLFAEPTSFMACVMNPPYRKVNHGGADRRALEHAGVTVTNLYAAFLALASRLLDPDGQLSAITPRSFANGVYFKPFRQFFLSEMSFDRLHVFEDRDRVFADSRVLQENVVFRATRRHPRPTVTLSSSAGIDTDLSMRRVQYADVVHERDPNLFVRIPVDDDATSVAEYIATLPALLSDLDVEVSTGRVVDFRAQEHLRMQPEPGTAPLIYPAHLRGGAVAWPQPDSKKPNALAVNDQTQPLLLPRGTYVLVRRFTAKEERRRVVATVVTSDDLPGRQVAFENHLNVYHRGGRGLPLGLARGLAIFLNSAVVDRFVRQFSGHTQINATDLRQLRHPSIEELERAGRVGSGSSGEDSPFDEVIGRSGSVLAAAPGSV